MAHNRDRLFAGPPPPEMKNPIGRWWCGECDCLATKCTAKENHVWKIKWIEEKISGQR